MEHKDIPLVGEWKPKIRIMLLAADKREYHFPMVGSWLAEQPVDSIKSGILNRKQCKELWHWLGRDDPAPRRLKIFCSRSDIDEAFPLKH